MDGEWFCGNCQISFVIGYVIVYAITLNLNDFIENLEMSFIIGEVEFYDECRVTGWL